MMRRLVAALTVLLGLSGAAFAQGCGSQNPNCVVPDRPNGDSTNAAANTRFVQNARGTPILTYGSTFVGNVSNVGVGTPTPVFGVPGSIQGTLGLAGLTSGTATFAPQAVAGTPTLTLPNTSGTLAVAAAAPLALNATTGGLTIATATSAALGAAQADGTTLNVSSGVFSLNLNNANTWTANQTFPANSILLSKLAQPGGLALLGNTTNAAGNVQAFAGTADQVPVVNHAGTVLSFGAVNLAASAAVTGQLPVANGGIGIASGTSGGIPAFTSTTTIGSSALLTANALVLGGGAGVAPGPLGSLGTTTTVLHGNASGAPSFGAVSLTTDVTGVLPIANGGAGVASPQQYIGGFATGINFNSVGDTAITIALPAGITNYRINNFLVTNTGTTASLTTAQFGVFSAAAGGGTAISAAGQSMAGLTSNTVNTNGSILNVAPATTNGYLNFTTLFFRITTAQGAAATGNFYIVIVPLP